jgi:DnaJ-class molecular chaperone
MSDPFKVLGLAPDADETAIRQRYLQLVREHPPDRDAQRFAEVRAAYDQLRDPLVSLEKRLFSTTSAETFGELLADVRKLDSQRRVPTKLLLSLGEP